MENPDAELWRIFEHQDLEIAFGPGRLSADYDVIILCGTLTKDTQSDYPELADQFGFDAIEMISGTYGEAIRSTSGDTVLVPLPPTRETATFYALLTNALRSFAFPRARVFVVLDQLSTEGDSLRDAAASVLIGSIEAFFDRGLTEGLPSRITINVPAGYEGSELPEVAKHLQDMGSSALERIAAHSFLGTEKGERSSAEPTQPIPEEPLEPPERRRASGTAFTDDHPVDSIKADLLNRQAIARALANNVRRAWSGRTQKRPFIVHLAGRWGSGKSTILNFLSELLRDGSAIDKKDPEINAENWIVVPFNAWQQQQEGHAWWSLLNAVALAAPEQIKNWPSRQIFRYWDWRWRITGQFRTLLIGSLIALAAFVFFVFSDNGTSSTQPPGTKTTITETREDALPAITTGPDPKPAGTRTETTQTINEVRQPKTLLERVSGLEKSLTLLIAVLTALGSIFVRRRKTEETLKELSLDPTEPLRKRYRAMIERLNRPVAVFIDDLDRCDADYVIEVLQAAQNIYGDVPVLYVVASDKDWLVSAYEQSYAGFTEHVSRPGRPLGHLFVEKIFQLAVTIPDLSSDERDSFIGNLTGTPSQPNMVSSSLDQFPELAAISETLDETKGNIEAIRQTVERTRYLPYSDEVQTLAFETLQSADVEADLKHYLEDFTEFMDANPRSIKRVINAFQFLQGYAFLAGKTLRIEALILWAILDQRFPYATRRLHRAPLVWNRDDHEAYYSSPMIGRILDALTVEEIETLRRFG